MYNCTPTLSSNPLALSRGSIHRIWMLILSFHNHYYPPSSSFIEISHHENVTFGSILIFSFRISLLVSPIHSAGSTIHDQYLIVTWCPVERHPQFGSQFIEFGKVDVGKNFKDRTNGTKSSGFLKWSSIDNHQPIQRDHKYHSKSSSDDVLFANNEVDHLNLKCWNHPTISTCSCEAKSIIASVMRWTISFNVIVFSRWMDLEFSSLGLDLLNWEINSAITLCEDRYSKSTTGI